MFFGRPIRQSSLECGRQVGSASPSQQLHQQQQHFVGRNTQAVERAQEADSLSSLASLKSGKLDEPATRRSSEGHTLSSRTRDNNFELRYELLGRSSSSGRQADDSCQHQDKQHLACQMDSAALAAPGGQQQSRLAKPRELSYADDGIR